MSPMFVPGPVDVHPTVLAAQAQPMLPHRSQEFETIFQRVSDQARQLFYTQFRVFITASSGSGLQEAAVRNFARNDILSCVNGAFSRRWYETALANGKQADPLETAWNEAITPDRVISALKRKHYEMITIAHNETSTGVENPIAEVADAVHRVSPDTLICVDAVSSLGGVKIEMDAWGLDMLLTSSQKCLALPPGLSLTAVSDRAMTYAKSVPHRGWYFDLVLMEKHRQKDSTPATPALSLIYALDTQLERIASEGLEARFARHTAMAAQVQAWALERDLPLYAPQGYRSKTVTTILNSRQAVVKDLNAFLKTRDMRIANGYGALKEKTFRIAHMGEITPGDVSHLLSALDEYFGFA